MAHQGNLGSIDFIPINIPLLLLSQDDWVKHAIHNFYTRVFYEVLNCTTGIKDKDKPIFYNNSNISFVNKFGLIHYIVIGYSTGITFGLSLDKNGGKPFVKQVDSSSFTNEQVKNKDVIRLDFKHFNEPHQIRQIFHLQYELLTFMHAGMSVASTPAYKMKELRSTNSTSTLDAIRKQLNSMISAFKRAGSVITMDEGDRFEYTPFDATPAEKLNDILIGLLSTVTGLPKAYIGANRASSLGDSGQADTLQLKMAISRYFNELFKGTVDSLLGTDVQLIANSRDRITWQLDALNALEEVSELDENTKSAMQKEILEIR